MWERLRKLRLSGTPMRHLKMAAIGPATRQAIEQHGVKVNVVPREYVAESVVASLRRKVKGKRVLLARAKVARDVIPRELRKLGARVDVVEAYETVIPESSRQRLRAALKSPKRRPDVDYVYQFFHGEEFRGATGRKPRARRPRPQLGTEPGAVCFHWADYFVYSSGAWACRWTSRPREYTIPGLIKAMVRYGPMRQNSRKN